jgi:hypothetical protein
MIPKMTLVWDLYLVASEDHRAANCAFDGPPWPMIWPSGVTIRIDITLRDDNTLTAEPCIVVNINYAV